MRRLTSRMRYRALLIGAVLLFSSLVCAQSSARPASSSAENIPTSNAPERTNSNDNDETAQFKHSAAVQFLSRVTGLSDDGAYWLAVIVNFGIVVALIVWASKKTLPSMFRNRTASIQKALEESRRASEDANRRLTEVESRLSHLDNEIQQMRAASEKEAAAEEERIRAAAVEDGKRIIESAEQEIAAATKAARSELTAYAADLAVTLAEKQIKVDASADQMLISRFTRQISNGAGKRN